MTASKHNDLLNLLVLANLTRLKPIELHSHGLDSQVIRRIVKEEALVHDIQPVLLLILLLAH